MSPQVKTFQELVNWLAATYHKGAVYGIAKRAKITPSLVDRWANGIGGEPKITTLLRLAQAYDLDLLEVVRLVGGFYDKGGPSGKRKGKPKPIPIAGGSAQTTPNPQGEVLIIRRWWPLAWGWLAGPTLEHCPA